MILADLRQRQTSRKAFAQRETIQAGVRPAILAIPEIRIFVLQLNRDLLDRVLEFQTSPIVPVDFKQLRGRSVFTD